MDDKDKKEGGPFTEGLDQASKAHAEEPTPDLSEELQPDPNGERVDGLLKAIDTYTEKQRGKRK
jgi:hypothetical protein